MVTLGMKTLLSDIWKVILSFFCNHVWENNLTTDVRMWVQGLRVFRCRKCKLRVVRPAAWITKVNS